ncbi:MAG: tRNA (adenosine(37)-N6)-threonylcarbamoyltransferase complex ATPase subunit type 1 TsaE [Parachlamydiaceae bacterium]|nr:tRNA (adenosine(37)-N6)-threonylcarbamoyltransferase complex ATPase subunit type 1 TsaE [Parachlamydiaceae bacterium]
MVLYTSHSATETAHIGQQFAASLAQDSIVCFFGDLGAGKTTFIKGMVSAFGDSGQVSSPTFVYLNIYEGRLPIYHFDLYRLKNAQEFLSMGFDEMFFANGICCVEWSERISDILPVPHIEVHLAHISENVRTIEVTQ